jgi:hypothetical protein
VPEDGRQIDELLNAYLEQPLKAAKLDWAKGHHADRIFARLVPRAFGFPAALGAPQAARPDQAEPTSVLRRP